MAMCFWSWTAGRHLISIPRYLGEDEVKALPGSALLFPLQIYDPTRPDHKIVRTILAVDRENKSMTFAGDMPQGWVAQLMKGTFDRLALVRPKPRSRRATV